MKYLHWWRRLSVISKRVHIMRGRQKTVQVTFLFDSHVTLIVLHLLFVSFKASGR